MLHRRAENQVKKALSRRPAVALMGPRQIGKTTLALNLNSSKEAVYLDLENRLDLVKIEDVHLFHQENSDKLVILDEVQRTPEIFAQLRGIIDRQRRDGHKTELFLFLSSASMELWQQSSESLAGRIAYLELYGIDALELALSDSTQSLSDLWVRGGFPESLLATTVEDSLIWRRDFIRTYLERDIPQLGPSVPAQKLERFWTMLAYDQGGMLNASELGRNLEVSSVTISTYIDLMVDLLLVRRLLPWTSNMGKRLLRSPKIYVRDSGLVHALLNIKDFNGLLSHPVVGGSWEGFVIENILAVVQKWAQAFYYRTVGGTEIDLILEFSPLERWAIEIKRSSAPKISSGFYAACKDIAATNQFVVYGGTEQFKIGEDTTVIPLGKLMELLLDKVGTS